MLPPPFYPSNYFKPHEHKRAQPQEAGWLGDGEYRLPHVDYKQPPPFIQRHGQGPRSPIFHFPPPGRGLLPPPLPPSMEPQTSPSGNPHYLAPASSPTFGYYAGGHSRQQQARPRTLIEVPRHDPGPAPTAASANQPELCLPPAQSRPIRTGRRMSAAESTLDPNSRPFTPSGRYHTISSSYPNSESETYSQASSYSGQQLNLEGEDYSTPGYTPPPEDFPPLSEPLGPLRGWEMEPDPLPQDPTWLLPNLDATFEEEDINNNQPEKLSKHPQCVESLLPPLTGCAILWNSSPSQGSNASLYNSSVCPPLLPTPPQHAGPRDAASITSSGGSTDRRAASGRILASAVEKSVMNVSCLELSPQQHCHQISERLTRQYESSNGETVAMKPDECEKKGWEMSSLPPPVSLGGSLLSQDFPVPEEYLMSHLIGDRVRPINIRQEHTDLLFFLFYCCQGDALQLVAASLLFERGWRYHKQERIWLARWPGVRPEEKTPQYEKGLYQFFHLPTWRRMPGLFRLEYGMLSEKTMVPEDLKTMYTRYYSVMKGVEAACNKNPLDRDKVGEDFQAVEGIKFLSCIL